MQNWLRKNFWKKIAINSPHRHEAGNFGFFFPFSHREWLGLKSGTQAGSQAAPATADTNENKEIGVTNTSAENINQFAIMSVQ